MAGPLKLSEHLGSRVSPRVATGIPGNMSDEPDAGAAPAEEVRTHHGIEPPNPPRPTPFKHTHASLDASTRPCLGNKAKLTPSFLSSHPTVNNRS